MTRVNVSSFLMDQSVKQRKYLFQNVSYYTGNCGQRRKRWLDKITFKDGLIVVIFIHCRWNLVYLTFILHGIGTLMPWNMFITAKDVSFYFVTIRCTVLIYFFTLQYFVVYKLGQEYTGQNLTYAANFLQFLGFASQVPNVIFNWLNIFIQIGYATLPFAFESA